MDALNTATFSPDMRMIPAGAVVERVYWAVPTLYTGGEEFDTETAAMKHAIDTATTSSRVTIDMRWKMSWEPSADNPSVGQDFVVERTTYATVDFARIALARRIKYSQESK